MTTRFLIDLLLNTHQVVLADGSIVDANKSGNPDLHKALKGGNNNFGIVTRFDLKAFPQGQIWGGNVKNIGGAPKVQNSLQWLENFARSSTKEFDSNAMVMIEFNNVFGSWIPGALMTYAKPIANPPIFQSLYNVTFGSPVQINSYTTVAKQNAALSPGGREHWATFTFVNNLAFMKETLDLITATNRRLPAGTNAGVIFQPLWATPRAKSFGASGGNSLGLEDTEDDLIIALLFFTSLIASTDQTIITAAQTLVDNLKKSAQAKGVYHPYIYANYAADFQDVMSGYGMKTRDFLLATAKKYDPDQLFQKQVPGGYKLYLSSKLSSSSAASASPPKEISPKRATPKGAAPPISTSSTSPPKGTLPNQATPKSAPPPGASP
jgi:hypothetical protein